MCSEKWTDSSLRHNFAPKGLQGGSTIKKGRSLIKKVPAGKAGQSLLDVFFQGDSNDYINSRMAGRGQLSEHITWIKKWS